MEIILKHQKPVLDTNTSNPCNTQKDGIQHSLFEDVIWNVTIPFDDLGNESKIFKQKELSQSLKKSHPC